MDPVDDHVVHCAQEAKRQRVDDTSVLYRRIADLERDLRSAREANRTRLECRSGEISKLVNEKLVRFLIAPKSMPIADMLALTDACDEFAVFHKTTRCGGTRPAIAIYDKDYGWLAFSENSSNKGNELSVAQIRIGHDELCELMDSIKPHEVSPTMNAVTLDKMRNKAKCVISDQSNGDIIYCVKRLTERLHEIQGVVQFDTQNGIVGCYGGVLHMHAQDGTLSVKPWSKKSLMLRNTGVDVSALVTKGVLDLTDYSSIVSDNMERFITNEPTREWFTSLVFHRLLGYHQKYNVAFVGRSNLGKSGQLLLLFSGIGKESTIASGEAWQTESNAALNALANASAGASVVYVDDIDKHMSERTLKRTGNGVPIITRTPGTGEPTAKVDPALVVFSVNPDVMNKSLSKSVAGKLKVVPESLLGPPKEDLGIAYMQDVCNGVYSKESFEYQLRAYNSYVKKHGSIGFILLPPDDVISGEDISTSLQTVTDEQIRGLREFVYEKFGKQTPVPAYITCSALNQGIRKDHVNKILQLKDNYVESLKSTMGASFGSTTAFLASARVNGGSAPPTSRCFKNPFANGFVMPSSIADPTTAHDSSSDDDE